MQMPAKNHKLANRLGLLFLARKLNFIFHANSAIEITFFRKIATWFSHNNQGTATSQDDDAILTIGR
jgi:hypothetical protein